MSDSLTKAAREFLFGQQGKIVDYDIMRRELMINPEKPAWENIRWVMKRLEGEKIFRSTGRKAGQYKVITQVKPVSVFSKTRERRPAFDLAFPRDMDAEEEMTFADDIVIREGDAVVIGGVSNYGKTAIALNFCGENIDHHPVLMGNEYTSYDSESEEYEPKARFLDRLDSMNWVNWSNGTGDKFELLPVFDDYAEHIVKDKINIIDWINLDGSRLWEISKIIENIKAGIGRGIAIIVLQKGDLADGARGGQFVKDFADCELLIDKFTERESMITIGKVKESKRPVVGRKFAYGIEYGVRIVNFREIEMCNVCHGSKWKKSGQSKVPCDDCNRTGYVNKGDFNG